MIGRMFGRWVVVSAEMRKDYWGCRCLCGVERAVFGGALRAHRSKSCGCLCRELSSARRVHGHCSADRHSREYRSWHAMLQRCYNPKNVGWERYGGRGVQVCLRWKTSFSNFVNDMGLRPDGTTLHRIKNALVYSKTTCRWATYADQTRERGLNALA